MISEHEVRIALLEEISSENKQLIKLNTERLNEMQEVVSSVNRNQQRQEQATAEHQERISTLEELSKKLSDGLIESRAARLEHQGRISTLEGLSKTLSDGLVETRAARLEHQTRLATLEDLSKMLVESQANAAEKVARIERHDAEYEQRIARFERSYQAILRLLEAHDNQLVTLTDTVNVIVDRHNFHDAQLAEIRQTLNDAVIAINDLTRNVNRYIASLNNGSQN